MAADRVPPLVDVERTLSQPDPNIEAESLQQLVHLRAQRFTKLKNELLDYYILGVIDADLSSERFFLALSSGSITGLNTFVHS